MRDWLPPSLRWCSSAEKTLQNLTCYLQYLPGDNKTPRFQSDECVSMSPITDSYVPSDSKKSLEVALGHQSNDTFTLRRTVSDASRQLVPPRRKKNADRNKPVTPTQKAIAMAFPPPKPAILLIPVPVQHAVRLPDAPSATVTFGIKKIH